MDLCECRSSKRKFFNFFFSSRRRHTRYWRDWSSDVCSSDLVKTQTEPSGTAVVVESDIERKKREADELLKGIIPDDVIDGSAGISK